MLKKFLLFGLFVVIVLSLAGCGNKTINFDTLEDMQASLPDDFYFFDFDSEIFSEAKEISVIEWKRDTHNGKPFYRYSIWYDIVNYDNDQEYRINIVGTHVIKPITITDQNINTGTHRIHNFVVIYIAEIEEYYYYFILQGSEHTPEETEIEYFRTLVKTITATKHKTKS
jgi:hypothetical protein